MKVTNSQQAGFVETFSCFFANDVGGLFVGAKPKKHRVAHLTVAGPLGEFYLSNELGDKPCGGVLVLHLLVKGLRHQDHVRIDRLQGLRPD